MTDTKFIEDSVAQAIQAIQKKDRAATVQTFTTLTSIEPTLLLTELFAVIHEASDGNENAEIPVTELLPEPGKSSELLRAVINQDRTAIQEWAPGGYPDLITGLLSLAAALQSKADANS